MEVMTEEYQQTELGMIPGDWSVVTLGDYCKKIGSGITPTGGEKVYKTEGRYFIRSQNIGWGNLILDDVSFIDEVTHQGFNSTEIELNDVFLNITGASIGRSAVADKRVVGGNVNQHVCIIRANQDQLDSYFLNYFLLSRKGQSQIDSFQSGGNRQGLNFGQIKTFKIPLPPTLAEQTAIATALSNADALITALEKLIAKKRAIKQGVMQKLLQPKEGWEVKKLGELGKVFGGLSGKTKADFGNGHPYIPFMNVMTNPVIDVEYLDYVKIQPQEVQNKAQVGDLFFNGSSETPEEVGMCSVLLEFVPNLYLNSFCFGFRLFDQNLTNGLFLSYLFRSDEGRKIFYSQAQGATRYNLSKANFLKLEIRLPSAKEQNTAAEILWDMDAEIKVLAVKLEKQRQLKQGMMQNLLTGKIRLV